MATTYKEFEAQFERIIKTYCYAAIEDIKQSCTETEYADYAENRYNNRFHENYANLVCETSLKKKLSPIFKIKGDIKITFAIIFEMFCNNLTMINITNDDNIDSLVEKFDDEDCNIGKYILSASRASKFGLKLNAARDNKNYFIGCIQKYIKDCSSNTILGVISDAFNNFLKACCIQITEAIWYDVIGFTITSSMLFMVLSTMEFDRDTKEYIFKSMNKIQSERKKISDETAAKDPKKRKSKKSVEAVLDKIIEDATATATATIAVSTDTPVVTPTVPIAAPNDVISDYIGNLTNLLG